MGRRVCHGSNLRSDISNKPKFEANTENISSLTFSQQIFSKNSEQNSVVWSQIKT